MMDALDEFLVGFNKALFYFILMCLAVWLFSGGLQ